MKFSRLLITPSKSISIDSESNVPLSQKLLYKAGYIRQLASGIFSYSHIALRSLKKIEQIIREEMNAIDGVEINMPVVHPADIWKETNRFFEIGEELVRFHDRGERDMVIAMTHEEVVAKLTLSEIKSYKQLPKLVYQFQTKFRDEARARGGLIRVREFIMKDSYSLDSSWEGLEAQYQNHYQAYFNMFKRMGLPVVAIKSDVGMMGGKVAHEYMYLSEIGEDKILICKNTGYQANKEVAVFKKTYSEEAPKSLEEVHTPGTTTIEALASYLEIDASKTAKSVFYSIDGEDGEKIVLIAVVPGHLEVNESKLKKCIGQSELTPATEKEIKDIGCEPGYGSPVGIKSSKKVCVVVDELIANINNYVMGANKKDFHLLNGCHSRDYEANMVADIVSAYEGATAIDAQSEEDVLMETRGVEVGNIFQLGTKYTKSVGATFMNKEGRPEDVIMGSYGIGIGRALGCLAQHYHDEKGFAFPISIAPFEIQIITIAKDENTKQLADKLYKELTDASFEVLYDDRSVKEAGPGMKFKDAELIGVPIHIIVSDRGVSSNTIEVKTRDGMIHETKEVDVFRQKPEELIEFVKKLKKQAFEKIEQSV